MANVTRLLIGRSWTLFVDGENFTIRGQKVLEAAGAAPTEVDAWRRDVFLWLPKHEPTHAFISPWPGPWARDESRPPAPTAPPATRAYYYTSMVYAEDDWTRMRLAIREYGFEPRLFRRLKGGRSKAVDLALATDVLTLAGEGSYEVAVIFAGDGDYVPVVEAVKRLGRHVVVGFFEGAKNGLSDELRIAADDFVDLTPRLVQAWQSANDSRDREAKIAANSPPTEESTGRTDRTTSAATGGNP